MGVLPGWRLKTDGVVAPDERLPWDHFEVGVKKTGLIREWERALAVIRAGGIAPAGQETEPLRIISVDVSGNVASFSPEFLGMRHVQLDATEDDLYIEDNLWNTTTLSDTDPNYTYRITGTDLTAVVFQRLSSM